MKKNLFLLLITPAFLIGACNFFQNNSQSDDTNQSEQKPSDSSQSKPSDTSDKKIKAILLKSTAKTTLSVTDRISTTALFEIKANSGQTLKTADKKVNITVSDPEVLKVERTSGVVSTFMEALKPGKVNLSIQSTIQEDAKLDIELTINDSVFDRQANDGFFGNSWENVDFSHEIDEENPYVKTIAEDQINHQFYFRDSYVNRCYTECEFTFYSEADGTAHMPKLGFVFSTQEINNSDLQSVSFIYFDIDCRGGKSTFYNIGYNEIAHGVWGWDNGGGNPLAKSFGMYKYEQGVSVGETFKLGIIKEGYNYHVFFNDNYVKSVETSLSGFSVDSNLNTPAPTICGLFDFKSEVKYSNYLFTTDETTITSKMPATPDFTDINGN